MFQLYLPRKIEERKMNLIVLDIDDTLTMSEFQHQLAYVNAMKSFGITSIDENWGTYQHLTDSHILKVNHKRNLSTPFDFAFIDKFEKEMTRNLLALKPVTEVNGAIETIKFLQYDAGYAVAFATGSFLEPALIKLNQAEIPYEENLVVGSNRLFTREEIVTEAIDRAKAHYGVKKFEHIISVGDGLWDWKTAQNLGVHFIGIREKNQTIFQKEGVKVMIKDWKGFDLEFVEKVWEIIPETREKL